MKKFWNWIKNSEGDENELFLEGAISEDTWWGDEITPKAFKEDLAKHPGDVTVFINSPGGDVFAAAQIYTMLRNHKGKITVKVHGLAASAASVVAMAGDETLISPVGMLMIHNPSTFASGEKKDMEQAIAILDEVKASILNAYEAKTGLSRTRLAKMMDAETWMNAKEAEKLGFVDGILFSEGNNSGVPDDDSEADEGKSEDEPGIKKNVGMTYSPHKIMRSFLNKLDDKKTVDVSLLKERLNLLKRY